MTKKAEQPYPPIILIRWDWKEQPNWDEIQKALFSTVDPTILQIDTKCDEYCIAVAVNTTTLAEAQAYYEAVNRGDYD